MRKTLIFAKMRLIFSLLIGMALVSGCVKVVDNKSGDKAGESAPSSASPLLDSGTERPEDPIDATLFADHLQIRVEPDAAPEKYHVIFHWPPFTSKSFVNIKLADQNLTLVNGPRTFDQTVDHHQTLLYTLEVYDAEWNFLTDTHQKVEIPQDWVVREGQNELHANWTATLGRLFLNPAVPLTLYQYSLNLQLSALISDHGLIQNFPVGSKARLDEVGLPGGNLTLTASRAVGNLQVLLRGQSGGDGSPAPPFSSAAPAGGPSSQGTLLMKRDSQGYHQTCGTYGAPGSPGQAGQKGHQGAPARNGGDSGTFTLSVVNGQNFTYEISTTGGSPGQPGPGSPGQMGGPPGPRAPDLIPGLNCSALGESGPQGPAGDPGETANSGAQEGYCVAIVAPALRDSADRNCMGP